ncbi:hypothetical protein G4G27_05700 [Sphingomonas sp. So64.6b]|uniref:hypothetical protein n=1 Tax=Sphingomonas sp. So64.6b TaxID=2997354 RepID=UPI0016006A01|nr:hypothetical protein [Sphingomonas sp. So64.6b]QNA83552.1 hypothetical protein G4G27_05700 [Sphingomonas sp. So64.6b]
MSFVQFLKSLDDFLYEVMTWLIFYPITMWRTLRRPLAMMNYADTELGDNVEQQYTDTLSPPLFLLLTLLLSHVIELALVGENPIVKDNQGVSMLISDDTSLLVMRLVMFSIFPLIMAAGLLRRQRTPFTRDTLKQPFYSQCYVAAPFAFLVGFAATIAQCHWTWSGLAALAIIAVAFIWYGTLQSRWFAIHLKTSALHGFGIASIGMLECVLLSALLVPIFS